MSIVRFSTLIPLIFFTLFASPPVFSQEMSMPGDINGDGKTNHVDFFLYALKFDPHGRRASSPAEDLNQDFEVDQNDLYLAIFGRLHGENGLPPIDLDKTGVIEGQVQENVGELDVFIPIPNAKVYILASTGHRFRIQTNETGQFRAESIPAGPVSIRVEHSDHHPGYARTEVPIGEVTNVTIELLPRRDDLASLRGKVEGAADPFVDFQEPLAGAVVRVMPIEDGQVIGDNNPGHFPGEIDPHQVAFTNDRGYYEIHDLPPGHYRMTVSAHGYESERRDIRIEGNENQVQDFLLFEVQREEGTLFGLVSSLGEAASDMKGIEPGTQHPIAGAHVLLEQYWEDGTDPFDPNIAPSDQAIIAPHILYETSTDNTGAYRIEGIHPGRYKIHVWAWGHFPGDATVEIQSDSEIEKNFRLTPIVVEYGSVAGTVLGVTPDSNLQTPLADALVSIVPRRDFEFPPDLIDLYPSRPASFVQSVTTDDDGNYRFPKVPVGLYDLHASARGWGRATGAAEVVKDETAEVDLVITHIPPPGPSSLSGTVWTQPDGAATVLEPASGAEVVAIPIEPDWTTWGSNTDPNGNVIDDFLPHPFMTRANSEGHYRFGSLRPGKYHVIASLRGYQSDEEFVGLPPESEVTQDFVLSPLMNGPGKVLGRVTFSPPSMASEPQPIAGAKVVMIGQSDIPFPIPYLEEGALIDPTLLIPEILYETRTNDDGYFEFPEVRPGHYVVQATAKEFQSERQEIRVPSGETVALHFDLVPDMGGNGDTILEGGVYQAQRTEGSNSIPSPIAGATVVAIPLCLNCDPTLGPIGPDGEYQSPRTTTTNERGRYRFANLPPGYVAVTVIAEGYIPAVQFSRLPEGRVTVLNFWLESEGGGGGGALHGTITQWTPYPTFAPVPVPGAKIYLEPLFPLPLAPTGPLPYTLDAVSDDQGNYRFAYLEPGAYLMDVRAEGFKPVDDIEVSIHAGEKVRQDVLLYPNDEGSAAYRGTVYHLEGDVPPESKLVLTPIPGATVRLVPDWLPVIEIYPPPNVGFDRITDNQGMFSFDGIPPGGYGVTILKTGYSPQSGHIELEENENLHEDWFLSASAPHQVHLRGRVQEDTGELDVFIPIEGATLLLKYTDAANGATSVSTQSNSNGDFGFPPVDPGTYELVVEATDYDRYADNIHLGNEPEPFFLIEMKPAMESVGSE